jgi:Glycosyl hydrolase catalytic core
LRTRIVVFCAVFFVIVVLLLVSTFWINNRSVIDVKVTPSSGVAAQRPRAHIIQAKSPYGFTLHRNFDNAALSDYLDLNVGWVRITDEWDEIETAPNVYNWSDLDSMVQRANAHDIKVDYVLWRAPQFRAGFRCEEDNNVLFGPQVGTDYVATPPDTAYFAGLVAARYSGASGHGRIDAIEILNEFPFAFNDPSNPGAHDACVDPKYYSQILPLAYHAVKDNSKSNPILVGMDSIFSQTTYYADWLNRFYAKDTKRYFDFVNLHYYNSTDEPDPSITQGQYLSFRDAIDQIHKTMEANGDTNKLIWVTEFGWSTQYARDQKTDYYVSPAQQARNLQYVLTTAKAAIFVGNMFFYTINTQASYPVSYGDCWQDMKTNCRNKPGYEGNLPAYTVFKNFIAANPAHQTMRTDCMKWGS